MTDEGAKAGGSAPPAGGAPDGTVIASRAGRPGLRCAVFYVCFFGTVGVIQPYFPAWLASRGLDAAAIGLVMSAMTWTRVAVNPWVGQHADRRGERRRLITRLALLAAAALACLWPAEGFAALFIVAIVYTACYGPILPLADNVVLLTAKLRGFDYGRVRLWGSAAFIAAAWGAGRLIAGRSSDLILALILAGHAVSFLAASALPDVRPPRATSRRAPMGILLRRPIFVLFVVAAALNMASHAVLTGFATLHWRALGLSDSEIGFLWGWGVVAEVALFAMAPAATARLGVIGLMALGAVAGVVRWTGTAFAPDLGLLLAFQTLHGITFGATHLGAMTFLQRTVPPPLSATAQTLYGALGMGLVVGVVQALSGLLYGRLGADAFLAMAVLSAASLALTLVLARVWRPAVPIA